MLRFALAGIGHHGRHAVVPAMQASDDVTLVALCDPRAEAMEGVGPAEADRYEQYDAMLATGGFDAVYIATMEDLHRDMVIDALQAGYHVLTEKPMAANAEQCREMIAAAEAAGNILAVGFEKRYHRDHRKVREWITAGLLGQVEGIHFQEFWDGHKTFGSLAERRASHVDQSGCLDCGMHCLDIARYLVGGGAWQNIHAVGRWFGETDRRHPVHASVLAELDVGPVVTLNSSYAYCANIKPRPQSFVLTVVGDLGVVNWAWDGENSLDLTLTSRDKIESVTFGRMHHSQAITYMVSDFASAVADPTDWPECLARAEDGLAAQEITDESLRQTARNHPSA